MNRILIGICSCVEHRDRRNTIRETWLKEQVDGIRVVFFVGNGACPSEEKDVIQLDVDEAYNQLLQKISAFFKYAIHNEDFEFLFKCDDDTYVCLERLLLLPRQTMDIIGHDSMGKDGFPSGGAGYFLSRKVVAWLSELDLTAMTGAEDQVLSRLVLSKYDRQTPCVGIPGDAIRYPRPHNDIISAHCAPPNKMLAIYAGFAYRSKRTINATHRCWSDEIDLYDNGTFSRRSTFCAGNWSEESDGELILQWFDWGTELFQRAHDGRYRHHQQGPAFNGDRFISSKLTELVGRHGIELVVETGTNFGDTTAALAEMVSEVLSIEIAPSLATAARLRFQDHPHIQVLEGDSAFLLSEIAVTLERPTLFYLDAHWLEKWPLLDELEAIAKSKVPFALIAIHDFKVTGLGFDSYGGQDLDFDYVARQINNIFPMGFTFEHNTSSRAEGARRGVAYFYGRRIPPQR